MDLDLVAGEVAQVGDDCGLLGVDEDHLFAFYVFPVVTIRDARAPEQTGGCGKEGVCSVGDAHHRAPLPGASGKVKFVYRA